MKYTLVLIGCLTLSSVLGQRNFGPRTFESDSVGPRIINGEDAQPGELPYQVSLQTIDSSFHFCGGSILNENYVLTAAHCVANSDPNTIQVVAGTTDLNDPQSVLFVQNIIVHPDYNADDSWRNDLALLQLATSFQENEFVSAVQLPEQDAEIPADAEAVVSGWGKTSLDSDTTPILQRATINIADQEYCRSRYSPLGYNVYDTQVCAFDATVERGSCQGDSGGPLTLDGRLVGIVSWALGCARTDYPAVYTRVPAYVSWIEENIQ